MGGKSQQSVEVFFSPGQIDDLYLRDRNAVVVDVLRASTTIATGLHNGAKEIIPVASIESAVKVSGSLFGDVTLRGGERNGKIIEGFNLGNSPSEYTGEAVRGKSIIYTSTNGSAAMVKARYAKNLVVAGFVNLSKVVAFLAEMQEGFAILCAGKRNDFAIEDAVCAGMILSRLQRTNRRLHLDDAGNASLTLHGKYGRNPLAMLQECDHGRFLAEIGYEADLKLCAAIDSIPVLPIMSGNVIRLMKQDRAQETAMERA